MWQKLKDQLPAVILTILVIAGGAYWLHTQTVKQMASAQQRELAALREQTNAEIKATAEDNRRQIEAVNVMLKDAIQKRASDMFSTDEELAKVNAEKVNQLAEAIALKIQPFNQLPRTPEEAEKVQNDQVDKVSSRLADRIQPILAQMSRDQNLTRESLASYSQMISDQISNTLNGEIAKNQQLNNNLIATQAVARESLALSHEVTALYLSTFKDQGLVTRLLTLPANVVKDVSKMSLITSRERKAVEEQLVNKMKDIESRLQSVQSEQPQPPPPPLAQNDRPQTH